MAKTTQTSTGKRGKSMQSMSGNKSTFTNYTGNIVSSGNKSGLQGFGKKKPAKPGKNA